MNYKKMNFDNFYDFECGRLTKKANDFYTILTKKYDVSRKDLAEIIGFSGVTIAQAMTYHADNFHPKLGILSQNKAESVMKKLQKLTASEFVKLKEKHDAKKSIVQINKKPPQKILKAMKLVNDWVSQQATA